MLVAAQSTALSAPVVAVAAGLMWANTVGVSDSTRPGAEFSARVVLRWGIVALGLRLSLGDVLELGAPGLGVVVAAVAVTFAGTLWLGRVFGLGPDLTLLIATGFSICGVSAIAAMSANTDATEEETAVSIGLVTVYGTVAFVALPIVGVAMGLGERSLGSWIGASTHDVAQVVAGASSVGATALEAAVVVKLTRVALLAPLVTGVGLIRRRQMGQRWWGSSAPGRRRPSPPLLPGFMAGFLAAVLIRSTGVLGGEALGVVEWVSEVLFAVAMVGLGSAVRIPGLRSLDFRPIALGASASTTIAVASLVGVLAAF